MYNSGFVGRNAQYVLRGTKRSMVAVVLPLLAVHGTSAVKRSTSTVHEQVAVPLRAR